MNESSYDVAVTGAGPAGAAAALTLALGGARVILLEAGDFPRHKVCGEFVSPDGLPVLERIHVLDELRAAGAQPVKAARVLLSNRRTKPISFDAAGLALSRYCMDELLWQASRMAGVECLANARVRKIEQASKSAHENFRMQTSRGDVRTRFVINAAGRNARLHGPGEAPVDNQSAKKAGSESRAHLYLGLKAHFSGVRIPRGEVQLFPFPGGYCGLVEVENGMVNAALLASYHVPVEHKPASLWQWVLSQNGALADRIKGAEQQFDWIATANISFNKFSPQESGVLNCGDTAGFIHPLTGDGMGMALRSGELAAVVLDSVLKGGMPAGLAGELYERAWTREFGRRLRWSLFYNRSS